ncbi:toll-Interleukin receptor [Dongia sp.]|uniref:toll-Interleukin receptor n=1 Tax=Dongia sp. TaxID=1977262 RepID=UPI0035AEFF9F
MPYLTESEVREAAKGVVLRKRAISAASILKESVEAASDADTFDVFLCHAFRDAELVLGAKNILESKRLKVYVDWIVDPQMNRSNVTASTAGILRKRMRNSKSLFYLYSNNSTQSRWMPWELGYFDGHNGAVAILPIKPDGKRIDFSQEEYLGLYPKVEIQDADLFINRTTDLPVPGDDKANYRGFETWISRPRELQL